MLLAIASAAGGVDPAVAGAAAAASWRDGAGRSGRRGEGFAAECQ